jgi:hypothetical protein
MGGPNVEISLVCMAGLRLSERIDEIVHHRDRNGFDLSSN